MPNSTIDQLDAILLQANLRLTRRLTFQQKCAAYALLQRGYPKFLIARVFNMSAMTAVRLAKTSAGNGIHPDVDKEFHRLGREEFDRIYITDDLITLVQRAVAGLERKPKTFDPTADRSSGCWEVRVEDQPMAFAVRWIDGEGWAFGDDHDVYPERYFTSTLARTAGYKAHNALKQRPVRISEREARAIWSAKTSNEVNKDLDKPNEVD